MVKLLMKSLILIVLILTTAGSVALGQRVMLMEIRGKVEAKRFYIGDELEVKLRGDDHGWYRTTITDFNVDRQIVYFDFGLVKLDEIKSIRTMPQITVPRSIRNKMLTAGLSFIVLSPLNLVINEDYPVWALYLGGSMIATAFAQEFILDRTLQHKIGRKKRLRLVDLTFYNTEPGPKP